MDNKDVSQELTVLLIFAQSEHPAPDIISDVPSAMKRQRTAEGDSLTSASTTGHSIHLILLHVF